MAGIPVLLAVAGGLADISGIDEGSIPGMAGIPVLLAVAGGLADIPGIDVGSIPGIDPPSIGGIED